MLHVSGRLRRMMTAITHTLGTLKRLLLYTYSVWLWVKSLAREPGTGRLAMLGFVLTSAAYTDVPV